jgi:hypothetical protein
MLDLDIYENYITKIGYDFGDAIVSTKETAQIEKFGRVSYGKTTYRKFKSENPPRVTVSDSPVVTVNITVADSVINDDLERLAQGENGAFDQLMLDIGGLANLSNYRLSTGKNLIELTIDLQLPQAAKYLIEQGFNVNAITSSGLSLLVMLGRQTYNPQITSAMRIAWIPAAKLLVEKGADLSSNDAYNSPLIEAVDCADQETNTADSIYFELLSAMLARGANINMIVEIKGKNPLQVRSPLYTAVENHNAVLAKFLLDHGANKNLAIRDGTAPYNTPLSKAAFYATNPSLSDRIHSIYQPVYQVLLNAS